MTLEQSSRRIGPRFTEGDRVTKTGTCGHAELARFSGTIRKRLNTSNKRGHLLYSYDVQWDNGKTSTHAQSILRSLEEA